MNSDHWYKNAVIYSLDLETFEDGNGDGVGDFKGLIGRLEYLKALGVDAIWLAPFQKTPNRDNGYDISDYYSVDPRHGTNGDFAEFMHEATSMGIRVLIDLVVNHTSSEHSWFQNARTGEGCEVSRLLRVVEEASFGLERGRDFSRSAARDVDEGRAGGAVLFPPIL